MSGDTSRGRPERTRGREAALQLLYRAEVGRLEPGDGVEAYWEGADDYLEGEADHDVRRFAEELFRGVRADQAALDATISGALQHWRLDRVALVDKLILRLAAFELGQSTDPPIVVIDQSLELARRFGGDDSVRFVNGVVDAIRKNLGK